MDMVDEGGRTPILRAAVNGHADVVELLMELGADIQKEANDGWTPLHRAAYYGRVEMVRMLVMGGADVTRKTKAGETPLDWAGNDEFKQLLQSPSSL